MNQYLFLRRMRGPIMLLVFGVTAILDEYTGIHYSMSWPLYIIAWGVLKLAENAVLAQNPPPAPGAFAGYPPTGTGYGPGTPYGPGNAYGPYPGSPTPPAEPPPATTTAIVPVRDDEERN